MGVAVVGPLRILHLEDSPSDADLAREQIAAEGVACAVSRVETREEYLAALDAGGFDLILADFRLPEFDGLEAFACARTRCPDVPFIIVTGEMGEETAIDTLRSGVTDYVLKGRMGRLVPAVRRALAERREQRQRREAEERLQRSHELLEEQVRLRTAELAQRNAELAAVNRDLESFVAAATHDLRSPLVTIGGFARRLEKVCSGKLAEEDRELPGRIVAGVSRMEALIGDLLAFFRVATSAPRKALVDMDLLVQEVFAGLAPAEATRTVRLEAAPLPTAYGDPAMLRVVLENLLSNAVKFTAPRETARIEVSGRVEEDGLRYCVRDNGVGFDMGRAGRLFEFFQRLHDRREFPGTGLGLATARRIVERHGGAVSATAAMDAGATFCFTLPKAPKALHS
jgi:signal transduction histidine kinase